MEGWLVVLGVGFLIWHLFGRRKTLHTLKTRVPAAAPSARGNRPQPLMLAAQPRRNHSAQPTPKPRRVEWVPAGQSTEVSGFQIPGLVYVGKPGHRQDYDRNTAHILDPSRSIRASRPDVEGETMYYWPHYAQISPEARLGQLQWQSTGRRDPSFGIGHVFLFFYGLEHRLFVDKDLADLPAIENEVTQLLAVYGANNSFKRYAENFLAAARIMSQRVPSNPALILTSAAHHPMGLDFRMGLARRLNEGPLDGPWLLGWYLRHPEKSLRTPATRCFAEFKTLFLARFAEQYPKGLHVRKSSRRLSLQYQSASGAFTKDLSKWAPGLSDPFSTTAPIKVAGELAIECLQQACGSKSGVGGEPRGAHVAAS